MGQTDLENKKKKIEALFRKAASAQEIGSLEEAATFTAKAQEMLLKFNLDMSDITIEESGNPCDHDRLSMVDLHGWTKVQGDWLITLYHMVSRYNFCQIVSHGKTSLTIIGEEHNMDMVKYIVSHLVPKIKDLRAKRWKEYNGPEKRNAFMRGYYRGAAIGIGEKLREQRDKDKAKYEKVEGLIKLSDAMVDEKMGELFNNLKRRTTRRYSGVSGGVQGRKDGKNMNINKGASGSSNSSKRLLK